MTLMYNGMVLNGWHSGGGNGSGDGTGSGGSGSGGSADVFAYAKECGFTGTEEDFKNIMANLASTSYVDNSVDTAITGAIKESY